jgi:integrase
MPLSDIAIRNLQPKEKMYRLSDGGRLYLEVYPNGSKLWRVRLKRLGKETMLSLGAYPTVSLKIAREKRDAINVLQSSGIDPVADRKRKSSEEKSDTLTFQTVYAEWLDKRKPPFWNEMHYTRTKLRAEKHILPHIGKKAISELTPPTILAVIREVEKHKTYETAHRVLSICSLVFRYAIASGYVSSDPCRDLKGALTPVSIHHNATRTKPMEVGKLLLAIDTYKGNTIIHCALKLSPLVFLRPSELRTAEWSEIDLKTAEWRIPAGRMKMREEHIVPLSKQALEILINLQPITGHGKYLFPSIHTGKAPCISERAIPTALRRMGYSNKEMTTHGFRAMASTLLNELGYSPDWIERQLAHAERNKVRAAYNRASYLQERRKMMQEWADYLDSLREKATAAEPASHRESPQS